MRLSGSCAGLSVIYNEQYFPMTEHIDYENIFTPQGMLGHVSKHPNLDFLMNIFNIPRVYSVSGFGTWNVGQHTMAVAFLALYWSAFLHYPQEKRDRSREAQADQEDVRPAESGHSCLHREGKDRKRQGGGVSEVYEAVMLPGDRPGHRLLYAMSACSTGIIRPAVHCAAKIFSSR